MPLGAALLAVPLPGGQMVHGIARASDVGPAEASGTDVAP